MSDIIRQIVEYIEKYHSFLITSHEAGDGDSLGAQLALAFILRKIKKKILILNKDPVPVIYNFLPGAEEVKNQMNGKLQRIDVTFVLDCGSLARTGLALPEDSQYINIDHHLNNEYFGDLNWVRSDLSSTCEMIYLLWEAISTPMDTVIASNIYTGILTDTGGFRFSNTSSQALHIAAKLVETGISPSYIASEIYDRRSIPQLLVLGSALSNLKLSEDQRLAYIYLDKETFQKYGASLADTEGFVNYPLSISSVEVALLFKEISENLFKISFRSKGHVNVAAIAEFFQGGGHHNAAGAKVSGEFALILEQVLTEINKQLATQQIT